MKKRSTQIPFADPLFKKQLAFGGTLMKKAKFRTSRPLNRKYPHHIVLRSSQATGDMSLLSSKNFKMVQDTLQKCAKQNGVKIAEFSNNGNHLHLLVWLTNRTLYKRFIRSLSGLIAQKASGTTNRKILQKKFWDYRPFSRVVVGWKGYQIARDYVVLNRLEAMGVIDYSKDRLKGFHRPLLI